MNTPDDSANPAILIVSNRLPITIENREDGEDPIIKKSSGGLVSGLNRVQRDFNCQWIGYLGNLKLSDTEKLNKQLKQEQLVPVEIPDDIYDGYYNGYSNDILWPLFHNFLATMGISDDCFEAYAQANNLFCEAVLAQAKDYDYVWVHDYQLMLLPRMLKQANPTLKISYFHHIPFPSSEIFRAIPRRKALLRGVLGADYVGFHTSDYVRHFLHSVQRILGLDSRANQVRFETREIKVAAHPLGIDFDAISETSRNEFPANLPVFSTYAEKPAIKLLGVDRLDYTKGLPERLHSFHQFLKDYPDYVGKVQLTQICVPSRQDIGSYADTKMEVDRLVGQINGEYAKPGYTPIQYIFRSIPFKELINLYKTSDMLLVTPLRDGLNLVCKEYIAAREDNDGFLVLSEFAGAASEMGEAMIVNPYDISKVARSIHRGIVMPANERQTRMKALRDRVATNTNIVWGEQYLNGWQSHCNDSEQSGQLLDETKAEQLAIQLFNKQRVFLALDYDGTLCPIKERPELAVPPEETMAVLQDLAHNDKFVVSIITGRPADFCERHFSNLPIHLVAEHGSFIRERKSGKWRKPLSVMEDNIDPLWAEVKENILRHCQLVSGSHLEEKKTCLVWHYRESEPVFAGESAQQLYIDLEQLLAKSPLSVYWGKKSLEVRYHHANKGYGLESLLELEHYDKARDGLLSAGDDVTDEDMHRVYAKHNVSIHVGPTTGRAKYRMHTVDNFVTFLRTLEQKARLSSVG